MNHSYWPAVVRLSDRAAARAGYRAASQDPREERPPTVSAQTGPARQLLRGGRSLSALVGNWLREMRRLFNLPFRVLMGTDVRTGNPFVEEDGDLVIVSVDTLTGEKMLLRIGAPEVAPYDLVILDEAHKLAARRKPDGTVTKTDRYRLAEALCGTGSDESLALPWQAQHVLLLTATPHMGVDYPYSALWRLLEPNVPATPEAFEGYPDDARRGHFIRRTKEEMVTFEGPPLYPVRKSHTWNFDLNPAEEEVYKATTHYMRAVYNKARILNRSAARLAMSVFQRRLASSSYALMRSFARRRQGRGTWSAPMRPGKD